MKEFSRRVYELAISIPPGRVTTYGTITRMAGGPPMASRSISSILSKAPNQSVIPWHRIVYADGKAWFDEDHKKERLKMYKREGIKVDDRGKIVDFEELMYYFD